MHRRFILKSLPIHPEFIAMCSDTKVNSWSKVSKLGEGKKRGPRSLIVMNWEVFIVCLSLRKILTALWNRGNFFGNFVGKLKVIFLKILRFLWTREDLLVLFNLFNVCLSADSVEIR